MIDIFRPDHTLLASVELDDSSYRYRAIMGDDTVTLNFSLPSHLEVPVGSYIDYQSVRYFLVRPESLTMHHSSNFEYSAIFEAYQAYAKAWKFRNPVDGRLKFPLTAKPHEHLQMFVDNMNMRDVGWEMGECIEGAEHLISYNHNSCAEALKQMAEEFDTEFEIVGKRVSLRKVEYNKNNPLPLSYGKGKGFLPGVGRSNVGDTQPIEVLYVQGGDKNINASKYDGSELHLPKGQTISFDGDKFSDEDGFNNAVSSKYVVSDDGRSLKRDGNSNPMCVEGSIDLSDIYPHRKGHVSSVKLIDAKNHFWNFSDTSIPDTLDYSKHIIGTEKMTVIFQSGMLAGREFDIKYFHSDKHFEIVPQEFEGLMMPNDTFKPVNGDEYVVFHCSLPDAYITDQGIGAEWELFRKAVKYLYENEEPRFSFNGELDGIWAKKNWENIGGRIILGGYILFRDDNFQSMGVRVRITGIKDYINNPHSPEIELSNQTVAGWVSTTLQKLENSEVVTEFNKREAVRYTNRRFRDAQETVEMLESSLLENFSKSVNPITVRTMALLVGDATLQFAFTQGPDTLTRDDAFGITYDNATRQLHVTSGCLVHLTFGNRTIVGERNASQCFHWQMSEFTSAVLDDPKKKYYLYAACEYDESGENQSHIGAFELSEHAIGLDAVTGYRYFLVGVLNSEAGDERSFASLYGFTEVTGSRITTDRIVSKDGKTYFDLERGEIGGKMVFLAPDGKTYTIIDGGHIRTDLINTDELVVKNVKSKDSKFEILADGTMRAVDGAFEGKITANQLNLPFSLVSTLHTLSAIDPTNIVLGNGVGYVAGLLLPNAGTFNGRFLNVYWSPYLTKSDTQCEVCGRILCQDKSTVDPNLGLAKAYYAHKLSSLAGAFLQLVCIGSQWVLASASAQLVYEESTPQNENVFPGYGG